MNHSLSEKENIKALLQQLLHTLLLDGLPVTHFCLLSPKALPFCDSF
jgi:hypothetical protein